MTAADKGRRHRASEGEAAISGQIRKIQDTKGNQHTQGDKRKDEPDFQSAHEGNE
ncbi:hypothetical protein GCM10027182_19820 [Aquaspirillum soli]